MSSSRLEPGGPEVLRPAERPDPVPGTGEVLIGVAAAGVNRPDVLQRRGAYPPPPGASDIPGLEVAGTVALSAQASTAGARATPSALWSRAAAMRRLRRARSAVPACAGELDLVEAAAIPETFFTVWTNVFDRGRLQAGETALFHGGTSGIGTTAIQLAAVRGATVFATAGSDEKARACEALGARHAINYRTQDFVNVIREITGGAGVDLILDIMGGSYLNRNLAALAVDGRLVQIGLMGGESASVDLRRVLGRRLTITGSTLRPRPVAEKGEIAAALAREVWPLLEAGTIKPIVFKTFPLAEAAAAHSLMESSEHVGKIVLMM